MAIRIPVVDHLVLDPEPRLKATVCRGCDAGFLTRRNACASCGGTEFGQKVLASEGSVVTFRIVHRAAPWVRVPFVSAIVLLDDGQIVQSNIVDIDADPKSVALGMAVELTTFIAGTDDNGTEAVALLRGEARRPADRRRTGRPHPRRRTRLQRRGPRTPEVNRDLPGTDRSNAEEPEAVPDFRHGLT